MQKYRVKALSVGGMSNKIFHSGDIVNQDAFPKGHADQLVADGFLEPLEEIGKEIKHIVSAEDVMANPNEDLIEGESVILPKDSLTKKKGPKK